MKKHYLIGFAACTLVLASCSSKNKIDDLGGGKTDDAISFSTSIKDSRGTAINGDGDLAKKDGNFGVTAFNSAIDPYMGTTSVGAKIIYDDAAKKWKHAIEADARYWPATGTSVFYGYTPFTSVVAPGFTKDGGMVFTNYVVPTDVALQEDFMWAYTSTVKAANVAMAFNHALVRVNFEAKMVTPNMKVDIDVNGITICNIMNKGTATVAPVTTPTTPAVAWTTATDATLQQIIVPSAAVTITEVTAVPVSSTTNAVMLMPQEFAAWVPTPGGTAATATGETGNKKGYLKVMCKIYSTATNPTYYHGSASAFAPIYIPLSSANKELIPPEIWKANNNITYTLNFGGGYADDGTPILNPTLFTTTVNNWKPVTGGDLL